MNRIGWKLFTIMTSTHVCYQVFLTVTHPSGIGGIGWWWFGFVAVDAACAFGLVGYAWQVRIAHQAVWWVVLPMYIMMRMGIGGYIFMIALMLAMAGFEPVEDFHFWDSALVVLVVYDLLKAYGLFRYAYLSSSLWRPEESN